MRVSSEILFKLGFDLPWDSIVAKHMSQVFLHLGLLIATWVLDPSMLHPFMQDPSITDLACVGPVLYRPTDAELSSLFYGDPSAKIFILFRSHLQ